MGPKEVNPHHCHRYLYTAVAQPQLGEQLGRLAERGLPRSERRHDKQRHWRAFQGGRLPYRLRGQPTQRIPRGESSDNFFDDVFPLMTSWYLPAHRRHRQAVCSCTVVDTSCCGGGMVIRTPKMDPKAVYPSLQLPMFSNRVCY